MTKDDAYKEGFDFAQKMSRPDTQAVAKAAFQYQGETRQAFLRGYRAYQNRVLEY